MHTIETAGLTLEPQAASHAPEMFAVLSDPAIYAFEREPPPSLEWLRARFTKLESRLSADGREHAAIAYELSSAYWGRGLAHEAVQAMISELHVHYRVRRRQSGTRIIKSSRTRS